MSKIYADTIETENPNVDITLGATGDAVLIPTGATLKTNKIADAGGNNIITSDGSGNLTVDSQLKGGEVLLSTNTFTNQASISFTSGIDSTYNVYIFKFININPATDNEHFSFQVNAAGASGFNETMTTTVFLAQHSEAGTDASVGYQAGSDQAQGTAYQVLTRGQGNGADESASGELHLFNPASTTYVKHFYTRFQNLEATNYAIDYYTAGYINITLAIDEISFKMSSGNFDGEIKMYGLSTS